MIGAKKAIIRGGLEALYFSGAHALARPVLGGVGTILTLHSVLPPRPDPFQPNRLLEVSPAFLEDVVRDLRRSQIDLVSLDEMHRRLVEGDVSRRFACLTFDDGYRDNREWAYPVLKRHGVPFAIYVPTSFPDQSGELWWLVLEQVIAKNVRIAFTLNERSMQFECVTPEEKRDAYEAVYWALRSLPDETELRRVVRDLAERGGVDVQGICRDKCMTWSELAELAADPLVTIGAHTVNHFMLRKMDEETARGEMQMSVSAIERALGKRPQHFSYPVGDPTSAGPREFQIAAEVGFKTAVTTRPGMLFPEHKQHLMALPRISLNGEYQAMRYVKVLLSGAASAVWNGFRRVNAD